MGKCEVKTNLKQMVCEKENEKGIESETLTEMEKSQMPQPGIKAGVIL